MVDFQVVCCMCGDVGFTEKLFRCNRCRSRFQHSYCSNYYSESSEPIEQCDWCQSERKQSRQGSSSSSRKSTAGGENVVVKSDYTGDKIKQNMDRDDGGDKGKNNPGSSVPSPRTATRRYKLLKDVMC